MRRSAAIACVVLVFLGLCGHAKAQGNNDQAILDYSRILELNPSSAETWWMRGNAYWDMRDYDRALQDYNQTIALDPNYALAYLGRGNVYLRKGDYNQALEEYDQVIEILPEFIGTYNNRGVAYREKGQRDLALRDLDFAIELKPDFAEAYYNRGLTHRDLGEHELAAQDLKRAVELNPAFAKAAEEGGKAAADDKQSLAAALQNPRSAAEMNAKLAKGAGKRAAVNRKKGDKGGAARASKRAAQSDSKQAQAQTNPLTAKFMLLYLLPAAVAVILALVFLRYRARL